MSKTILITGGAGFVGSSLGIRLKRHYPEYQVIALDNLKRRGSELNLARLHKAGVSFVHGDIRNYEDFGSLPKVDAIIEASAEPSVLAGVNGDPDYVINTNLLGTTNCLKFARKNSADFIFLSTSRIYPIAKLEEIAFEEKDTRFAISAEQTVHGVSQLGISEDFPLGGSRSFYGTTKLCSELLIEEYNQFYNLRTVIDRCGVLTGPWQMGKADQGVVVLWMARHFWQQPLQYIGYGGDGKQIRDILHVDDLYRLIDYQLHNFDEMNGRTFNAGGGPETSVSLLELTAICEKLTKNKVEIRAVEQNRAADIRIYVTDNSKVTAATGWKPEITVGQILEDVYLWLKENENSLKHILQ